MIRFIWSQLSNWERASAVLFLVIIFTLGYAAGVAHERHNWQAKAGRLAYFLAVKLNEHSSRQ